MYIGLFNLGSIESRLFETSNEALNVALDPFEACDITGVWESPQARVLQALTYNTPESTRETGPLVCPHTRRVLIAWTRLDNRPELAAKLAINSHQLDETTDPELIMSAFNRWGDRCVEHLLGDFSFCLYDPVNRSVFSARDPMGTKPLYYHQSGGILVVTTGARVFHALDGLRLTPDEAWMTMYAIGQSQSFNETCWPQVSKLPPGHTLRFDIHAAITTNRYFNFSDDAPQRVTRDEHYVDEYRAVLEASVVCRLRTHYVLGSETTGGIDSSSVTGFSARNWQRSLQDFHTFGFAWCEFEPSYILETSRHHYLMNNHIATGRDLSDTKERLQRTLLLLGYPEEHADSSGQESIYRQCESLGARTLLSGFGGDEAVSNPGNLLLLELADQRQYLTLMRNLPGAWYLRPARLLKHLLLARRTNVPSQISRAFAERWPDMLIKDSVNQRHQVQHRYMQAGRFDSGFRRINAFVLGERLGPSLSTRLENCTLMAAGRNIEYRWPLLDVRLIQQYLSTPSIEKYSHGYGRYLHRRAIEGVVPPKVQWKRSKYMGEPLPAIRRCSNDAAEQLITRFTRLIEALHPALDPIVDSRKIRDRLPVIKNMASHDPGQSWTNYASQIARLEALNSWLTRYHP